METRDECQVPGAVPEERHCSCIIHNTSSLRLNPVYLYTHFTYEETGSERRSNRLKVTLPPRVGHKPGPSGYGGCILGLEPSWQPDVKVVPWVGLPVTHQEGASVAVSAHSSVS